jgi:hypothetical protein
MISMGGYRSIAGTISGMTTGVLSKIPGMAKVFAKPGGLIKPLNAAALMEKAALGGGDAMVLSRPSSKLFPGISEKLSRIKI